MTFEFVCHATPSMRSVWGPGALGQIAVELDRVRAESVVLVCGRSMSADDATMSSVREALGTRLAGVFSAAREHSPVTSVEEAARVIEDASADAVIALGGGSAIVTARAASILVAEAVPVRELATTRGADGRLVSPRLAAPKLPQFILATTPTTAYAKAGAAVRDTETGERLALFDPKARASVVIFDERLAETAPSALVVSASLNALSMSVDGVQSARSDPLAEAYFAQAIREIVTTLPCIVAGDEGDTGSSRVRLMIAALMAGHASDFVGTGISQPLSHAIGPVSTTSNGNVEALLLPHVARFNMDVTSGQLAKVGGVVSRERVSAHDVPGLLEAFLADIDAPTTLREIGIEKADFPTIIAHAHDDWSLTRVPKPIDADGLRALLEEAW
ncbi:Alcohol dehydrogenase, class IV [Microbacterium sp. cf046]|uniref:iron-containing alcohol dehydrogenase family protein n=1 Tax=Microbacterium sp. cf046 TaxID=1761803 RepID=UPI0008E8B7FA|nr:iron-containing alcohol dehydrogenase family protein [Microbacterium sp. cf046]SFS16787.1 Alcohol dehydrogenase, class IV [Microbacterium sp. cf046]